MYYFGEGKGEIKSVFIYFERVLFKSKIKDFFLFIKYYIIKNKILRRYILYNL